ncbi:MAG TPA: class I SAM-dependent methyltransferase [Ramlibacter sp.]|nr:class I SAM-dependent methyltransferase [Ramlibacter sp.]
MINDAVAPQSEEFGIYYDSPRSGLIGLLPAGGYGRALEVGCGSGANLVELQRRFPDCRTTGIELREEAAQGARGRVDEVLVGSVLDPACCDFAPGSFDVLVLSHVLEHFAEPAQVLQRVLPWLAPQGRVLVALPNVRHASVLRELVLHGDFRYRSSGLMDHTHLRFFTRRSAIRFMQEQGLAVERCEPDFQGRKSALLRRLSFGLATEFAAFAFNFLARKA